jgi:hypothetical protein
MSVPWWLWALSPWTLFILAVLLTAMAEVGDRCRRSRQSAVHELAGSDLVFYQRLAIQQHKLANEAHDKLGDPELAALQRAIAMQYGQLVGLYQPAERRGG